MSADQVEFALKVAGVVIALLAAIFGGFQLVLAIKRWKWDRRPSELTWEVDENYAINVDQDRARFPAVFAQENPARGQTGILVKVTYHGRQAITITGLTIDWNFSPWGRIAATPRTLHDGESWEALVFTQMVALDQTTAITIEADGGRRFTQAINADYRHRLRAHTGAENP